MILHNQKMFIKTDVEFDKSLRDVNVSASNSQNCVNGEYSKNGPLFFGTPSVESSSRAQRLQLEAQYPAAATGGTLTTIPGVATIKNAFAYLGGGNLGLPYILTYWGDHIFLS
jgi:hypothetical protein